MGFLAEWRASRERRQLAERYLRALLAPVDAADVDWLAAACGDRAVAQRELGYARRALGLIVAERDALDDRTASDVSHALSAMIASAGGDSADSAREWGLRYRAYTAALAVRGQADSPAVRFARVLLQGAGVADPSPAALGAATEFVRQHRSNANESLRSVFGAASLPEDVRPSALRP